MIFTRDGIQYSRQFVVIENDEIVQINHYLNRIHDIAKKLDYEDYAVIRDLCLKTLGIVTEEKDGNR